MRTAIKAASGIANSRLPASLRLAPWSTPAPIGRPLSLVEMTNFGSNPGRLAMLVHLPADPPPPGVPLIVVLHGCGQAAADFASDSGWTALADQFGIPLVVPEQSDQNNRGRCFNWFRPLHTTRGLGEMLSIRQMVAAAIAQFDSDPSRVFIAGLSAGAAMTVAALAAYPDVFAAGASVAGLPVGAAASANEALRRMSEAGPVRSRSAWADQVRRVGPIGYAGPWPRLSIWHGTADQVVDPANAILLADQWCALHDLTPVLDGEHEQWCVTGQPVVELWRLPEQGHAWPPGATQRIWEFWGIAG